MSFKVNTSFDGKTLQRLDAWRAEARIPTRSQAVRTLVAFALEQGATDPAFIAAREQWLAELRGASREILVEVVQRTEGRVAPGAPAVERRRSR